MANTFIVGLSSSSFGAVVLLVAVVEADEFDFFIHSTASFALCSCIFAWISIFFCWMICSCFDICAKRSFREVFDTNGSDPFTPRYAIFVSCAVLSTQLCGDSARRFTSGRLERDLRISRYFLSQDRASINTKKNLHPCNGTTESCLIERIILHARQT